jgi:hypothetical protein
MKCYGCDRRASRGSNRGGVELNLGVCRREVFAHRYAAWAQYGHGQSRTSGRSSPCCSIWRWCSARRSTIWPRGRGQAGHAVDHVHDQVEAVEVVEHHHVERRGGGALLLVAAQAEALVIGPPVGEPMDQPGVAVERDDHRSRVKSASKAFAARYCSAGCLPATITLTSFRLRRQ